MCVSSMPRNLDARYQDTEREIVGHIFVHNRGSYLFYYLPFCCGDDDEKAIFPLEFFNDLCNEDRLRQKFDEALVKFGNDIEVKDLSLITDYDVTFKLPVVSIPISIPYIVCVRDLQICGTVVRKLPEVHE